MKLCELHALMQFKELVLNGIKSLTARTELQESDCELTKGEEKTKRTPIRSTNKQEFASMFISHFICISLNLSNMILWWKEYVGIYSNS
jgi:hypothetical protein